MMAARSSAQQLTVIVVGDAAQTVRKFHLRPQWLRRAAAAGVVVALAGAGAVTGAVAHYRSAVRDGQESVALRAENEHLRSQLRAVEERVQQISATLDRVESFDAALRSSAAPARPDAAEARGVAGQEGGGERRAPATKERSERTARPKERAAGDAAAELSPLARAASRQESTLRAAQEYFEARRQQLASAPSVWPARGWVTSDFGVRVDPYTAERVMHRGVDIATSPGHPVQAPSDAVVTFAGTEDGYGKVVVLDHGEGVHTRYAHLSSIFVKAGDRVKRGARVAAVGSTGRATGPHLHYEVRVNGVAENPRKFILE